MLQNAENDVLGTLFKCRCTFIKPHTWLCIVTSTVDGNGAIEVTYFIMIQIRILVKVIITILI